MKAGPAGSAEAEPPHPPDADQILACRLGVGQARAPPPGRPVQCAQGLGLPPGGRGSAGACFPTAPGLAACGCTLGEGTFLGLRLGGGPGLTRDDANKAIGTTGAPPRRLGLVVGLDGARREGRGACAGSPFHLVPREGTLSPSPQLGSASVIAAGQEAVLTDARGKGVCPPHPHPPPRPAWARRRVPELPLALGGAVTGLRRALGHWAWVQDGCCQVGRGL